MAVGRACMQAALTECGLSTGLDNHLFNGLRNDQVNPIPTGYDEMLQLKDGSRIFLRPIRPDDAPRLQEVFQRLSTESIRMRFLETAKHLTDRQAAELANLDYQNRMALVGVVPEDGVERIVVVARYALIQDTDGQAECAVVVRDDYQGRGLGKIAMARLIAYARSHGVKEFVGAVHITNSKVMQFIDHSQFSYTKKVLEPGLWEIHISIH